MTFQAHLDTVGVMGGFREQIPDNPFREGAASLILFPDHSHPHTGCDVRSVVTAHGSSHPASLLRFKSLKFIKVQCGEIILNALRPADLDDLAVITKQ